jgi:hypothetical protein
LYTEPTPALQNLYLVQSKVKDENAAAKFILPYNKATNYSL